MTLRTKYVSTIENKAVQFLVTRQLIIISVHQTTKLNLMKKWA